MLQTAKDSEHSDPIDWEVRALSDDFTYALVDKRNDEKWKDRGEKKRYELSEGVWTRGINLTIKDLKKHKGLLIKQIPNINRLKNFKEERI
jgi:hypothetical protein